MSSDFQSDNELLLLMAGDNEQAFTTLYNRYWDSLYILSYKHLRSVVAAEEIVQEVFLIIWQKRKQLSIQALPEYLAAVTRFTVYRHLANEKKKDHKLRAAAAMAPAYIEEENVLENKMLLEIVKRLTNHLPEKCRLVFIYNKLLDQPLDEVADRLSISKKTAEAHLTKALKIIRGNLGAATVVLAILFRK